MIDPFDKQTNKQTEKRQWKSKTSGLLEKTVRLKLFFRRRFFVFVFIVKFFFEFFKFFTRQFVDIIFCLNQSNSIQLPSSIWSHLLVRLLWLRGYRIVTYFEHHFSMLLSNLDRRCTRLEVSIWQFHFQTPFFEIKKENEMKRKKMQIWMYHKSNISSVFLNCWSNSRVEQFFD